MKTINYFLLFLSMSIFFSCSNDETAIQSKQPQSTTVASRTLPPPTPGELRGLYDAKFSNGTEFNLLFEYGNNVTFGSPTVHDMLSISGMQTNYSYVGTLHEFIIFDGTNYFNFRFNYNSATTKLTGTYGIGTSYTNLGTFTAKKHITGNSGLSQLKGYWLGYYGADPGTSVSDYVMVFEENGKVSVAAHSSLHGSFPAIGTYAIYGNTVVGSYTYFIGGTYSFKFDLTDGVPHVNGTWGYGSNNNNGGNFNLSSQNFY
jgi:hypothetical protein